ncbi:MAG: flagellar export chaperone FlgN [Pirellulales bacterium]|nr:flagellar export chaperone FlgN [Pirellulales bacterium]
MEIAWDSELANLMTDLLATQEETLSVLARKRELLITGDGEGLAALGIEEQQLVERLKDSLKRREQLLKLAAEQGLPHKNLQTLSESLPNGTISRERRDQLKLAKARARLLRHHGLTNWVVAQRTLIHLSQMLEIIATGGRLQPTYDNVQTGAHGKRQCVGAGSVQCVCANSGALVDQEA